MTALSHPPSNATRDALWGGALTFWQPARGFGYRFNLDPVLLSGFVGRAEHVLDLGAGCGVIGTLLLAQGKAGRVTSVEIQTELADHARRNVLENGDEKLHTIVEGDLRTVELPTVDCVVFNPPYFRAGEGRSAPDPGREMARRERHGTLADFISRGLAALATGGSLYIVLRVDRLQEISETLENFGAAIVKTRLVQSRPERTARHVLVQSKLGAAGAAPAVIEPLIVHQDDGYSDEVRALLQQGQLRS